MEAHDILVRRLEFQRREYTKRRGKVQESEDRGQGTPSERSSRVEGKTEVRNGKTKSPLPGASSDR